MLLVEVMAADNHVFTKQIDSVIEVPQKGDKIICGKCHNETTVANVGFPYRAPSNGQHDTSDTDVQDENQTSAF